MKFYRTFFLLLLCLMQPLHAKYLLFPEKEAPFPLSHYRGQWVLIHYWASWCAPCLDEIETYNRFYKTLKRTKQAVMFAVNYDLVPAQEQIALSRKYFIKFPILLKDPKDDLNLNDIQGVPATFVFNPEGDLETVAYGQRSYEQLCHITKDVNLCKRLKLEKYDIKPGPKPFEPPALLKG